MHSGYFNVPDELPAEWRGRRDLARLCQGAELSNRQAQVVCLFVIHGKTYGEIQHLLRIPWKEVWRSCRRANELLARRYPNLECLGEAVADHERDEAYALLQCLRNTAPTGDFPVYQYDENNRRVGLRARVVSVDDLLPKPVGVLDLCGVLTTTELALYSAPGFVPVK